MDQVDPRRLPSDGIRDYCGVNGVRWCEENFRIVMLRLMGTQRVWFSKPA